MHYATSQVYCILTCMTMFTTKFIPFMTLLCLSAKMYKEIKKRQLLKW